PARSHRGETKRAWLLEKAELLPRCFLFAASRIKPDAAARKARDIEIALVRDALKIQNRAQSVGGGLRLHRACERPWRGAVRHCFRYGTADQIAFGLRRKAEQFGHGGADVGVADRQWIDI